MRLNNVKKCIPNKNDEVYTPKILVDVLKPYLHEPKIIWSPFDTADSEFVINLREWGHEVIHGHIDDGDDFFEYEPEEYDLIISNPPFSIKMKVLERLYKLNKPFAMVMGLPILNYQVIGKFFHDMGSDLQLLIVDKKIGFNGCTASFNNSYFCRNLLLDQIVFEHLEHNNTGVNFVPSRMYRGKWCMYDWYMEYLKRNKL